MPVAAAIDRQSFTPLTSATIELARRAAFFLGLAVILFSSTALSAGWWGNAAALLNILPDAPTMKANTALALLCCALAVSILASNPEQGARKLAAAMVIAALAIYIYVFEVGAIVTVPFLSTMSLPTAFCFLILAVAATLLEPAQGIGAAFLADRPSSMIVRQLLLPIILLPLLVGVTVTTLIEQPAVSMAVLAVANTAILCGITIAVSRRIDDYDQRQREMHDRSVDLMQQATAANAAKSRFLATMSHDLRTPLNAIIGFSEVMHKETLGPIGSPLYKDYVGHIQSSGEALLGTINSILDIAHIEAGVIVLHDEVCNIHEIAGTVLVEAETARKAHIGLVNRIPVHFPRLTADRILLRRIISNLVDNAIKFTPPGGEIVIDGRVNGQGEISILVEDTGCGFDPGQADRLTEAFEQAHEHALVTKTETGMGLGLAIVKNFASLHHARVWISSAVGRGTRVEVAFPAHRFVSPAPDAGAALDHARWPRDS
jgi:signal transduction histidine kinase